LAMGPEEGRDHAVGRRIQLQSLSDKLSGQIEQ
jgi:hypothetical protein